MHTVFDNVSPASFRADQGPFDLIGDVHGCAHELEEILEKLGWSLGARGPEGDRHYDVSHPEGRKMVLLGDLVDRGPRSPDVIRLAMQAVDSGWAYAVVGNHDDKFRRWMAGRPVTASHGLQTTIDQFSAEKRSFWRDASAFIERLPSHLILDNGALVVAHAGVRASMQGQDDLRVRSFAMYGDVTGRKDEYGNPVRGDWAETYNGAATVVHGHVAEPEVREKNNVICIDTGCAYGGALTAMRWPEREIVQVAARRVWYRSPSWDAKTG